MVISPQNIVAKKGVGYQTYSFDVSVVKGDTKIKQGEWTVDYKVNGVYSGSYVIDGVLYFDNVTLKDDYTLHYEFILYPEGVANLDLTFTVNYEGVTYPQSIGFQTLTEPEIYEIVPTNAYCIHNPNEAECNVKGLIEGYLYKIVGTERTPVVNTDMEVGYNIPMSTGDTNGIFDVKTDRNGFFTSGRESQALFDDTYGDDVMGESTAIVARYKVGNEVLAQINVGISQYGMKGERGAPLRVTEWVEGWTYYNGKGANDPYTDVVKYNGYWYLCKTSHMSRVVNKPSGTTVNTSNWEVANQFDMIATKVLLAANAHIDLLGSNTIEVKDSLGNTTAGMSGGDGVQLWGGGERETAKFRVYDDGDVFVEGTVNAKALYRGCKIVQTINYYPLNTNGVSVTVIGSNSTYDNPTTEDFIIIKGNEEDWIAAKDVDNWTGLGLGTEWNATDYGNVYIPNAEDVLGKEVVIANQMTNIEGLLLYTPSGGNNAFWDMEDCESITLTGIKELHLVAARTSDYLCQWYVLSKTKAE